MFEYSAFLFVHKNNKSLYYLLQCRARKYIHDIVVHQFELNDLIKASSVGVSVLYHALYVVQDSTTKKNRKAERMNQSKN